MNNKNSKNPHAVALGKLGGKIGGLARTSSKTMAARRNGVLGGRPKMHKNTSDKGPLYNY